MVVGHWRKESRFASRIDHEDQNARDLSAPEPDEAALEEEQTRWVYVFFGSAWYFQASVGWWQQDAVPTDGEDKWKLYWETNWPDEAALEQEVFDRIKSEKKRVRTKSAERRWIRREEHSHLQ